MPPHYLFVRNDGYPDSRTSNLEQRLAAGEVVLGPKIDGDVLNPQASWCVVNGYTGKKVQFGVYVREDQAAGNDGPPPLRISFAAAMEQYLQKLSSPLLNSQ